MNYKSSAKLYINLGATTEFCKLHPVRVCSGNEMEHLMLTPSNLFLAPTGAQGVQFVRPYVQMGCRLMKSKAQICASEIWLLAACN